MAFIIRQSSAKAILEAFADLCKDRSPDKIEMTMDMSSDNPIQTLNVEYSFNEGNKCRKYKYNYAFGNMKRTLVHNRKKKKE